ncbi:TlpA family protein disulfide reductase [Niabella ginsengisoli]|uniref:TlpA family protein disulfide reductase n=1 Tax=Niabella ginsengisoli TaxID=522298 RepID=A0ABS9SI02_9BACT|nr:TlpA family protein disulfide reductase [Niabella ginsengisoli]MCH5597955.1 TlpA family protein disulfide reductase [Niabella ginsengisoli]
MKILTLLGVMTALCLYLNAQVNKIKPLTISDTPPDLIFNHIINQSYSKASLSDFKGKNVIIDFWSRYCLTCISSFPKIQQLQDQYNDRLQFVLANPHDYGYEKEVNALLQRVKQKTGFYPRMPIALNDTLLNLYFPHNSVPHYVWISKNRKITAITGADEITHGNIEKFLAGNL